MSPREHCLATKQIAKDTVHDIKLATVAMELLSSNLDVSFVQTPFALSIQ